MTEEIGLDFGTDTYNGGLSLNIFGAEKLSIFLGSFLREYHDIPDHRSNPELNKIWGTSQRAYIDFKQTQLTELEKYGEIKTFTYKP